MDEDVARLVREERLVEAAELASTRGDSPTASALFERACEWGRAAHEAMRSGDATRALMLAVQAGDDALAEAAANEVGREPERAGREAVVLERRGADLWAARLYEAADLRADAARAWEHAGDAVRAATLHEELGEPVKAARALEAALRRDPSRWPVQLALGTLLLRHGKLEASVRTLQKVPPEALERRAALSGLVEALGRLGLAQAEREARSELEGLGGPIEDKRPSSAPPAPVTTRLYGRYEVVREVASSATARVLECIDVVRGERVAVKAFSGHDVRGAGRDALARFEREVRVLAAINHPNVVPLRDYVIEGPSLVLAWMAGGTLETMLAGEPLPPSRAVEIASAVLSALGEAHRVGVLHRDVKPANVLFDEAGNTRLADFGVAHLGDLSTTATAGFIGTFAYMSPEQRQGRPATVQSDLYAVGALLREMLTGEHPTADEPSSLLPSDAHSDLDARHDHVVLALTDPDPAARPADAFEARRLLHAVSWPTLAEPAERRPPARRGREHISDAARITVDETGEASDRWTGHRIERVVLTEETLRRASAFARAADRALQTVLRVDREAGEIWLEVPPGGPLESTLTATERARLSDALRALHAAGISHGAVDLDHVRVDDEQGSIVLRFEPSSEATSTADTDFIALARL